MSVEGYLADQTSIIIFYLADQTSIVIFYVALFFRQTNTKPKLTQTYEQPHKRTNAHKQPRKSTHVLVRDAQRGPHFENALYHLHTEHNWVFLVENALRQNLDDGREDGNVLESLASLLRHFVHVRCELHVEIIGEGSVQKT
jgi:hypothetical protein